MDCECGCPVCLHDDDGVCRVCICSELKIKYPKIMVMAS